MCSQLCLLRSPALVSGPVGKCFYDLRLEFVISKLYTVELGMRICVIQNSSTSSVNHWTYFVFLLLFLSALALSCHLFISSVFRTSDTGR